MLVVSIFICIATFAQLVRLLRRQQSSLGLPAAYLFSLLLIHLPGGAAHFLAPDLLFGTDATTVGMSLTALGAASFVTGVWFSSRRIAGKIDFQGPSLHLTWLCLGGGLLLTFVFQLFERLPSIGAAVDKAGGVWMLAVMLGMRAAVAAGNISSIARWLALLAVYPTFMLLFGGFLSYGSTAAITVLSILVVSVRSKWKLALGLLAAIILGINFFLSYFQLRDEIREATWGGAKLEERVSTSLKVFENLEWFDPRNEHHVMSLDQRLNQNFFAGLAAQRIEMDQADFLWGRSLWDGLIALIPRVFWEDKPISGGSGQVVQEMTGLVLSDSTSWGIGNVMEFHINFGIPGVIVGFLLLGFALGYLDRRAAETIQEGDLSRVFVFFLPAIALSNPGGSVVEMFGGTAAAYVAALFWKWIWLHWGGDQVSDPRRGRLQTPV